MAESPAIRPLWPLSEMLNRQAGASVSKRTVPKVSNRELLQLRIGERFVRPRQMPQCLSTRAEKAPSTFPHLLRSRRAICLGSAYCTKTCESVIRLIDGGALSGEVPHSRFGRSAISRISIPPFAISECQNHARLSGLPLSCAD